MSKSRRNSLIHIFSFVFFKHWDLSAVWTQCSLELNYQDSEWLQFSCLKVWLKIMGNEMEKSREEPSHWSINFEKLDILITLHFNYI